MNGSPRPAPIVDPLESLGRGLLGQLVDLDDQVFYRISEYEEMSPFLMSVPSDTDLWMFVTSGGGLTAGRVDPNGSLFPYENVDELHDAHRHAGPLTLIKVPGAAAGHTVWEPFAEAAAERPGIERNLYKNTVGNQLLFEEINHELGFAFRYRWAGCGPRRRRSQLASTCNQR